ncbi:MAG: sulfatase-like hydrolase/transferase [Planctomycetaceae bacterium]
MVVKPVALAWRGFAAVVACAICGVAAVAQSPLVTQSPLAVQSPLAASRRPNVVLVISDDQQWRDYGFMGHEHLRTPRLDQLAKESLVFPRGYVPSSLCCPSLASIITGRYPHEHGIVGNDPPDSPGRPRQSPQGRAAFKAGREAMNRHLDAWPTLPRLLAAAGYRSLQTGKWWQGDFARGGFDEGMTKGERHGDEGLAIGRGTMQPVYDFIGRCRDAGKPFVVWYAPMLPHDPHDPPQELVDHYATRTDSVHVARYWGNVERFDRTVGDLLDHLDREDLSRDTLVVYVTDNGWIQNPANPRFAPRSKLSPYDGGLRTPIMLRRPGVIRPRTSPALATSLDIVPTVLAACGVEAPADLPGVNLLDDDATAARRQVFGECYTHTLVDLDDPARSLLWRWTVQDRWKLIVPAAVSAEKTFPTWQGRLVDEVSRAKWERGEAELFDVVADPDEGHDLAAEHPDVVARLRADLDRWWTPPAEPVATAPPPRRRPNLLVFLADDLGARDLGCTGSGFYRTPTIDALASAGMTFTRAYAAAPVCSPTRAALMTGTWPARVGITNYIGGERRGALLPAEYLRSLPQAETTIAERLRSAGYATGIFGKWHLGPPEDVPVHGFDVTGLNDVAPGHGPADDPHHARALAAKAVEFIATNRGQPFFCYVPLHSVHVPLRSQPELVVEERKRAAARAAVEPREIPEGDRGVRAVQDHPVYSAMIEEMDEAVSTVLAALEEQGVADHTLVVFTSDNGGLSTAEGSPTSNLPLRAGKGYLYEGGIRVPLLVRWPGVVAAGSTTDVPVTTLDVAATLLDAGGAALAPGEQFDGLSLRPLLDASGPLPGRDLTWHYPHYSNQGGRPGAAILAGDSPPGSREKLVLHDEDGRVELFDLIADAGERHDLAGERPARAAELRRRLDAWRAAVGARMPTPNPQPVDPFGPEGLPPRQRPAAGR